MKNIINWSALSRRRRVLLVIGFLLADLALAVIYGLNRSIDIPTFHLDGAYQTASGLYRLADGQWPGKDFYPYLGVGLLYFLYPIFLFAGSNVAASIFATHFTVVLSGAFSVGLIGALFSKSQRLLAAVFFGTLFLCLAVWPYPHLPAELITHSIPGNSLRPLRGFLPYLCAAAAYVLLRSKLNPLIIYGGIGGIAGAAFLWSNDFGIPTSGLLIFLALAWAYRSGNLSLKTGVTVLGVALLVALVGLMLATKGHGIDLLKYNFVDVAHDQYWYFAFWDVSYRIFSVSEFFTKFIAHYVGWWGLVLVGVSVLTYFRPSIEHALLLFIGLTLLGGGAVASVGGHLYPGYVETFIFWCKTTLVIGLAFFLFSASRLAKLRAPLINWITTVAVLAAVSASLWLVVSNAKAYMAKRANAQSDTARFFVPEMGGYLPDAWKAHVNLARDSKGASVAEEYWGIWSSISKNRAPVPVDSAIHALGATRWKYANTLQGLPDFIVTSAPGFSAEWHGWNLSANWWFYKIVLANYEPSQTSPSTYLWKKTASQSSWPATNCRVENNPLKPEIVINTNAPGYYEVTLQYQANALSSRSLLFVKNNLNYAYIDGYLSLDTHAKIIVFPAALGGLGAQNLDFKLTGAASDDLSKVSIQACQAKKIIFDAGTLAVLPLLALNFDDTPFDLTDRNWVKGVAINWAGFFVRNNILNRSRLMSGKKIKFADAQIRTITRQENGGSYLNILLDGGPLDGNIVGFPKKFEVQE